MTHHADALWVMGAEGEAVLQLIAAVLPASKRNYHVTNINVEYYELCRCTCTCTCVRRHYTYVYTYMIIRYNLPDRIFL